MEAAKSSIKKFMSKDGHHETSVHETVAPAVQKEQVQQEKHERATTAVDREVHQDHYHTTEQPISHSEVLPEQHHHNLVPVEHRSYEHDNDDEVKRKVAAQQSQYRDESTRVDGQHTHTAQPSVAGEHVHHHVHETIQPVVNKQTIEPHVVHTTVPIHEVHHNESKHHAASTLPAMSMDEFKNQGGSLTGRAERQDRFDGCPPDAIAGAHGGHAGNTSSTSASRGLERDATQGLDRDATHGSTRANESMPSTSGDTGIGARSTGGPFNSHKHDHPQPASYGNDMHPEKTTSTSTSSTHKPSLMDKLNPKKDADGDGKPGFMK